MSALLEQVDNELATRLQTSDIIEEVIFGVAMKNLIRVAIP